MLVSPVVLLPLARHASLDSGPQFDGLVLAAGALAVLALAAVVALWTGRPAPRRAPRTERRGIRPRGPGITRPLTAGLGVRFATGRVDAPALGAVLGVAASAAIFVGAFTFTGNLDRQLDDRHRYGLNWDQKIGAPGLPDVSTVLAPALTQDRDIEGLALGTVTTIHINGQRVDVLAVDQLKGMVRAHARGRARARDARRSGARRAYRAAGSASASATRCASRSGRPNTTSASSARGSSPSSATPGSSAPVPT